jgi:hypothetical protein
MAAAAEATGVPFHSSTTVDEALEIAISMTPSHPPSQIGRIVISGSVYLVGEARQRLIEMRRQSAPESCS